MRFKEKVVLITGGSEGIGRAIATAMAAEGARLALAARTQVRLEEAAATLRLEGVEVLAVSADVTSSSQVQVMVDTVQAAYGRIDILVNNAGQGLRKPFIELSDAEWDAQVALNLSSVVYCCRAALPVLRRQGGGQIINIASRAGLAGEAGLAAYCAVKHGVVGLTRALAEEERANGIRACVICPGAVATARMERILPQVDKSGWLKPEDVARIVVDIAAAPGMSVSGRAIEL